MLSLQGLSSITCSAQDKLCSLRGSNIVWPGGIVYPPALSRLANVLVCVCVCVCVCVRVRVHVCEWPPALACLGAVPRSIPARACGGGPVCFLSAVGADLECPPPSPLPGPLATSPYLASGACASVGVPFAHRHPGHEVQMTSFGESALVAPEEHGYACVFVMSMIP